MKFLKNPLMLLGVLFVISTLIFAVQNSTEENESLNKELLDIEKTTSYKITAIEIPEDLNFAGEKVPFDDPEILERVDREFLVNTYWQSNALLLMKRAKATEVACDYLKKGKEKFGNWTLAAASYNAGSYGIQKYMNAQDVNAYYDLLLGQETGRYVFRILAIKEILSHPGKYGFDIAKEDMYTQVPTFNVEVDVPVTNFADFAKQYEINYKILKRHNPWLREPHLNNNSRKKYIVEIPNKGYYKPSK